MRSLWDLCARNVARLQKNQSKCHTPCERVPQCPPPSPSLSWSRPLAGFSPCWSAARSRGRPTPTTRSARRACCRTAPARPRSLAFEVEELQALWCDVPRLSSDPALRGPHALHECYRVRSACSSSESAERCLVVATAGIAEFICNFDGLVVEGNPLEVSSLLSHRNHLERCECLYCASL